MLFVGWVRGVNVHPNRREFKGVMTFVDRPSDKPPAGTRGRRVLISLESAEKHLHTLLGMAVNFGKHGHEEMVKCGVVTAAEIIEGRIEIAGHLFALNFPAILKTLHASADEYGMSYEISDAQIANVRAEVWEITSFYFVGVSILPKKKSAYFGTSIELKPCAKEERCQP